MHAHLISYLGREYDKTIVKASYQGSRMFLADILTLKEIQER